MKIAGNILVALSAAALAAGAWYMAFQYSDPAAAATTDPTEAVALYRQALQRDNASPYRFADLGEALVANGKSQEGSASMERALAEGADIPAILLRYTNFSIIQDRPQDALKTASRVLEMVSDYDGVLFNDFDQLFEPAQVIAAIGDQRRAMTSWLSHLIAVNNPNGARMAWSRITEARFGDDTLASSYVAYLLNSKNLDGAVSTWAAWLGTRRGDYPDHNLLFNANLAQAPLASPLDWKIPENTELFETMRDGNSVRVHFLGKANVSYDGISQLAVLPRAGRYRLSVRVKTEGITTDEGVRLTVADLGLSSGSITGSHDWMPVVLDFTAAQPRTIRITVVRRPSAKFDNKIEGTAWFKDFILAKVPES